MLFALRTNRSDNRCFYRNRPQEGRYSLDSVSLANILSHVFPLLLSSFLPSALLCASACDPAFEEGEAFRGGDGEALGGEALGEEALGGGGGWVGADVSVAFAVDASNFFFDSSWFFDSDALPVPLVGEGSLLS